MTLGGEMERWVLAALLGVACAGCELQVIESVRIVDATVQLRPATKAGEEGDLALLDATELSVCAVETHAIGAPSMGRQRQLYPLDLASERDAALTVPEGPFALTLYSCSDDRRVVWFANALDGRQPPSIRLGEEHFFNAAAETALYLSSGPFLAKRLAAAVELASASLKIRPTAQAHRILAIALEAQGSIDASLDHRRKVVALLGARDALATRMSTPIYPGRSTALTELSHALRLAGRAKEAKETYERALASWDALLAGIPAEDAPPQDLAQRGIVRGHLGLASATEDFEAVIRRRDAGSAEVILEYLVIHGRRADLAVRAREETELARSANDPYWQLQIAGMFRRLKEPVPAELQKTIEARARCAIATPIAELASPSTGESAIGEQAQGAQAQGAQARGETARGETAQGARGEQARAAPEAGSPEEPCQILRAPGESRSALSDAARDHRRWSAVLAGVFLGKMPVRRVEDAIRGEPDRATEVFYYSALAAWGHGDIPSAVKGFEKAGQLGVVGYIERRMAREAVLVLTGASPAPALLQTEPPSEDAPEGAP